MLYILAFWWTFWATKGKKVIIIVKSDARNSGISPLAWPLVHSK